ncbi:hypothetical protein [Nonomuraea turcica]|uniref:hypothetical protein n=1 Tax=Nonomuraea sp. G32 TaxID=3067274 RepID=UPI00273CAFCB|nr:hypothetical protein [Nonomuraea sp. G32]MDP4501091.1 hypothetical protein [Nonomuraea sp. G32]
MRRVPYVTAYDGENVAYQLALVPSAEATDGIRLSYADPTEHDWMFGVLWHRHGLTRAGHPQWKLVNTSRQRRCMLQELCQVCGQTAVDSDTGRIWWVIAEPPGKSALGASFTNTPPTCRSCIGLARLLCPRLREWSQACTVAAAEPYGVVADVFKPVGRGLVSTGIATELPLDAYRDLEYALAKQLIVSLEDLRPEQVSSAGVPMAHLA